jgi:hypothetical protein
MGAYKPLTTIGRAERIAFPAAGLVDVPAKVDTGAYRSSVWAEEIAVRDGKLYFRLLGDPHGKLLSTEKYELVDVENSFGHHEERYSVYLTVVLAGRRVHTNFTLANRASKTYPVLLGRKLLKGKFIVDVSKGTPIPDEESTQGAIEEQS